jgi:SAM-dependent methyltransferase
MEEGFVWSTHQFGLYFPNAGVAGGRTFLIVHNPHESITLDYRIGIRVGAVVVPHGDHTVTLDGDTRGQFVDFTISPRTLLSSDVRALGLMFRGIGYSYSHLPPSRPPLPTHTATESSLLTGPDGLDRLRAVACTTSSYTVGTFLREGWITGNWQDGAIHLRLDTPLSTLLDAEVCCTCEINACCRTLTFRRDATCPNRYRAELALSEIVSHAGRLIDVMEPIDIEFRADSIGQYRSQGLHWRGRGIECVPDEASMARVAGQVSPENFLLHGASWFVKLDRLVAALRGQGLAGAGQIVDWGCGCARISRHFPLECRTNVVGFDIDPVNIAWCREHIRGMRFGECLVDPPLPLESDSVDVLFAHSVLTHLGEQRQHQWLAEIRRVLKPGGYAFLTVLAELSWYARFYPRGATPDATAEYLDRGFIDHGWQQDVGVDASCPGAYVQVSHGCGYVRSKWSQYFNIVDWIDGFADLQTLVVVRK